MTYYLIFKELGINHPLYLKSNSEGLSFLGIIKNYGSHETKILPIIEFKIPIRVVKRYVVNLQQLTYIGAYSTLKNEEDLKNYFLKKYSINLTKDEYITVYDIIYIN